MKLTIRHFTDTGHILPDTEYLISKGCARLHGHTYAYIIDIEGSDNLQGGMLIDFKAIKQIIDELDHRTLVYRGTHEKLFQFLNKQNSDQIIEFPFIPSSENISRYLAETIYIKYPDLYSVQVQVCEGYKGDNKASWSTYFLTNK